MFVAGPREQGQEEEQVLASCPPASLSGLRFIKHCDTFISVNPEYFIPVRALQANTQTAVAGDMSARGVLCCSSCYKYKCNQFSS